MMSDASRVVAGLLKEISSGQESAIEEVGVILVDRNVECESLLLECFYQWEQDMTLDDLPMRAFFMLGWLDSTRARELLWKISLRGSDYVRTSCWITLALEDFVAFRSKVSSLKRIQELRDSPLLKDLIEWGGAESAL